MRREKASGSLLLGHIIPSLKALDQVINSEGPLPFPKDMRIEESTMHDVAWSTSKESGIQTGIKGDIPVAVALGISVRGDIALDYQRNNGSSWQFDRLDTQIIRPTRNYIRQCLNSPQVAAHIEKEKVKLLNTWKLFMISGIRIARGARTEETEGKSKAAHVRPGMNMAEVINAEIGAGISRTTQNAFSGQHANDYIWAVQLREVSKSVFRSDFSERISVKGATLGLDEDTPDIKTIAGAVGLVDYETYEHQAMGDGGKNFFILPAE
ncbi:hypothetical protein LZ32DRAFT_521240 [Colletotrichum eremochloae]|nr:hypothetical protein LZ32DRAFT_521240 [Colletotrichum eremochloae]